MPIPVCTALDALLNFGGTMRLSSFVVSWILIVTLTASPVMAQQQPSPKIIDLENAGVMGSHIVPVLDENNNPLVGNSILMALPPKEAASLSNDPGSAGPETKAPGKTKSTIVALLLLGGAITAVILALPGGGGNKPAPVAAPVTPTPSEATIITAGQPRVSSPN